MDYQLIALIFGGIVQIIVALIAGFAAYASRKADASSKRAEDAANHGNKKIAELQKQLLNMNKRVNRKR